MLGAKEDAVEIYLHHPPPVLEAHLRHRAGKADPRRVDQHIEATVFLEHCPDHGFPVGFARHIKQGRLPTDSSSGRRWPMKTGAPTAAVTSPIGSSAGLSSRRAAMSDKVSRIAPIKAPPISRNRLSEPFISRKRCGTINPTKLMIPVIDVATATSITFTAVIVSFSRLTSTPKYSASSSPIIKELSCRAYRSEIASPTMVTTARMITALQFAPESVPRFQNVIERACGSRAMYEKNPTPLKKSALTAMPVSNSAVVDSRLAWVVSETRNTHAVATAPPRHAASGRVHSPV